MTANVNATDELSPKQWDKAARLVCEAIVGQTPVSDAQKSAAVDMAMTLDRALRRHGLRISPINEEAS
jgi:hypothetical protein